MPQTGTQRKDTLLSPLGPGWAEHGPAETGLVARGLRTDRLGPVDLDVAPGAALAVMGASGSGKTLLLRALADLDPARGDLSWRGVDRFAMAAPAWRRRVAYVPAEPGWWAATPADHMADHMANGAAARALLPAVDLTDDHLARPIAHLSTGERQRLALVRALILAPEVLLLDEPTAALDHDTVVKVADLLAAHLAAGVALVLVTHDPALAARLGGPVRRMAAGRLGAAP